MRSLWRVLGHRESAEQALDDELHAYVDLLAGEYERTGMAPEDALRRARLETGGIEQVKEATRDSWIGSSAVSAARELRFSLRALRNAPVFTALAVVILAIGIGGATAIFTVIKGSLLQPLPAVHHPAELISLEPTRGGTLLYDFSIPYYRDVRRQSRTLAGLAGYDGTSITLEDSRAARRSVWVSYVTGTFFAVLGVTPAAGRLIQPADEAQANPVAVLAYDLWQSRYGGDPSVVGSAIDLAGRPVTVIGVAPPRFVGAMLMHPMEVWMPVTVVPLLFNPASNFDSRTESQLRLVGRLAPGRSIGDARRELSVIAERLAREYSADSGRGIAVFAGAGMTNEERTALARMPRLLAVAVALLLLIACANVASLSLVRAAARRRELATRLALGASRRSLVGRQVIEGGVLAAGGGLLGVAIARLLVHSDTIVRTGGMPARVGLDATLDWRVLLVAVSAALLTAIVVTTAPVLQVLHVPPGAVLKDGSGGALRRRSFGQRALVAGQIAASLVLLASSAIVFTTFRRVLNTDVGFDVHGVTVAGADISEARLDSAQAAAYRSEWLRVAGDEPTIAEVALASAVPPASWERARWVFHGAEEPAPGTPLGETPPGGTRAYLDVVSAGYFDLMRIPIAIGRGFTDGDDPGAEPVVIVSRRLADAMWPKRSAVGEMLSLPPLKDRRRPPMRVVGVAGDVRFASLFDDAPAVAYMPAAQHADASLAFAMRSRSGRPLADSIVRRIGERVNASVPVYTYDPAERVAGQVQPQRVASAWIGVFGAVALLLAAIGLYGVVAQDVLQRTRELAVRSALGATPGGLARLVLGEGMRAAAVGSLAGAFAVVAAVRVLQSQFAGVSVADVRAATVALGVLALTMVAACWLPARTAARLDPADALRSD